MSHEFPLLERLTAFTDRPDGGNPAGVWIGDALPEPDDMQRIAAEIGYSETAFLAPARGLERTVRYYSPKAEVSFCGHATIASGVALGQLEGEGVYRLSTSVGEVPVAVERRGTRFEAALTSVEPRQRTVEPALRAEALACLGFSSDDLDPAIPPSLAYAGAWHLVFATRRRETLDSLSYDFDRLLRLMQASDLTTLQLIWREAPDVFHSRNPFPVGGVVEDPATGAAAAALGGYLRDAGLIEAPTRFLIHQGVAMGRPSRLEVVVPASGGITVRGTAVPIPAPPQSVGTAGR